MENETFRKLTVTEWRQFRRVELEFADRVTILTGRNGTGKTTILNILAQHSQFSSVFIGTPPVSRDSLGRFTSGSWRQQEEASEQSQIIGNIVYQSSAESDITVNRHVDVGFTPTLSPKHAVSFLNITSHRQLPAYKRVDNIPTNPITRERALQNYQQVSWSLIKGDVARTTPLTRMKEALISMAAFGSGNDRVAPNEESRATFNEFEERLREIIPKNIGFQRIYVQIPDVIIETKSGRFLIDASSGGLMSLMDITWQITLFGRSKDRFVVVIDEPENHLHPSMQREFLPGFSRGVS